MSWHAEELLWLLGVIPLLGGLAILGWRSRRRMEARFGAAGAPRMLVGRSGALRGARTVLLLLGISLAIIALSRPQYGSRTKMLRKRGVDVVVVLDFSKSMLARDVRPSRIDRAKAELTKFISELAGDRIGIVAFAGETMEFPMTVDYAAAALFFRDLGPHDMPVGGTAIGRALVAASRLLERSNKSSKSKDVDGESPKRAQVVILMTDGEDHEGDPIEAAKELAEIGGRVFVVGIGSKSGEPIPSYAADGTWTGYMRDEDGNPIVTTLTEEAESQLKQIAEITGGRYMSARRGGVGMSQIRAEMLGMEQAEFKARRVTVHEERYALVLLAAFLLIVLEALMPEALIRNKRRSP